VRGEGKDLEQGLFDDLQYASPVVETKTTESPINEAADWGGDFEQLEDLIGTESAWKVAGAFAGSTIYIPKGIFTNKNYFDIRKKYKAGSSYRELAIEFGYTETHIRNIIHRKKENV
jgi:Mor family transcriptional regulator